jgi:hypothetical protein
MHINEHMNCNKHPQSDHWDNQAKDLGEELTYLGRKSESVEGTHVGRTEKYTAGTNLEPIGQRNTGKIIGSICKLSRAEKCETRT